MLERQNDMPKDRLTDRKTDRRQNDFSALLSKQKLFRMSTGCQKDRKTGGQMDRQTDRKTDRLFNLVIKTKVFQNVNRMSKRQSDRKEDIQSGGQIDRVTE